MEGSGEVPGRQVSRRLLASGKVVREGFGEVKVPPRIKLRKGFRRMWVRSQTEEVISLLVIAPFGPKSAQAAMEGSLPYRAYVELSKKKPTLVNLMDNVDLICKDTDRFGRGNCKAFCFDSFHVFLLHSKQKTMVSLSFEHACFGPGGV